MTHQKNNLIKTRKIRFLLWVKSEVSERAKRKKKATQQKVKKNTAPEVLAAQAAAEVAAVQAATQAVGDEAVEAVAEDAQIAAAAVAAEWNSCLVSSRRRRRLEAGAWRSGSTSGSCTRHRRNSGSGGCALPATQTEGKSRYTATQSDTSPTSVAQPP